MNHFLNFIIAMINKSTVDMIIGNMLFWFMYTENIVSAAEVRHWSFSAFLLGATLNIFPQTFHFVIVYWAFLPTAFPVWTILRLVVIMAFPIFFPLSLFCTELQWTWRRGEHKKVHKPCMHALPSIPHLRCDIVGILPAFPETNYKKSAVAKCCSNLLAGIM